MTALALMLLGGSLLSIAAVLLCAPGLRRSAGPAVAYGCWLLPWLGVVASVLLPVQPAIPSAPVLARAGHLLETPTCQLALLTWFTIAALFLAAHLLAYRAFLSRSTRDATERGRVGAVRILAGPHIATPAAAGILHRRILLPADFDTAFSADEQRMILRHEHAHHDRRDIAANLAALVMLALHWWNPLAFRAHRRFRADQELACDATATAGLDRADRLAYATAILKCAARPPTGLAAAMSGRTEAAARLSLIASDRPPARAPFLSTILTATALAALVFAEAAATRSVSSAPPRPAATAAPAQTAASTPDAPNTPDFCDRSIPDDPRPARYDPAVRPVRLIVARGEPGPAEPA